MKELFPLHGIVTALNTPFDQSNQIDIAAVKGNVREALKAGIAGFLVPVMASEVQKLSYREKCLLVETVLETVNGKVPVFAGSASGSFQESKELVKTYLQLGCDHILIQLPFESKDQFTRDFHVLADLGAEVIMLQDWSTHGYGLPDELIMQLFDEISAFRCLKVETIPAGIKYSNILKKSDGRMNVSGGWAVSQLPEALERGVHAFMPTGMHWIYFRIYDEYKKGNKQMAIDLFYKILPVLAFSNQHLDISIHFFKRLLWKQGIYPTPNVREPILPFDHVHQESADLLIKSIISIENTLKS